MKRSFQRDEIASMLYGLSDKNVRYRNNARMMVGGFVYLFLVFITIMAAGDQLLSSYQRLGIIAMSFIKYIPLLLVIYMTAKTKAAKYLDDIFELQNQELAEKFIEEVTFASGYEKEPPKHEGKITIKEGKISEKDEVSPIILIGGPGQVVVNLGSAALLEQLDGDPKVIFARKEAWKLESFERIREIGEDDQVGKREYAAINLRDQFVTGLKISSRTKDGIPIEAQDVKIIFSIVRNPKPINEKTGIADPYSFDERAVQSLVYNQTIMTPPPQNTPGISFPWDTTVIPLVIYKLDEIIRKNTLSQILASISQQELDTVSENEQTLKKIQVEITGEMTRANIKSAPILPQFKSRSKITEDFYEKTFVEHASELGIAIHWIDVGTWQMPNGIILQNLRDAWDLTRTNANRSNQIEGSRKKFELDETIELINNTIVASFDKGSYGFKFSDKDYDEILKNYDKNSEVKIDRLLQQEARPLSVGSKKSLGIARDMLQAFRREFLSAKEHIQKENKPALETQNDIARIDKAIHDIENIIFHTVKK